MSTIETWQALPRPEQIRQELGIACLRLGERLALAQELLACYEAEHRAHLAHRRATDQARRDRRARAAAELNLAIHLKERGPA